MIVHGLRAVIAGSSGAEIRVRASGVEMAGASTVSASDVEIRSEASMAKTAMVVLKTAREFQDTAGIRAPLPSADMTRSRFDQPPGALPDRTLLRVKGFDARTADIDIAATALTARKGKIGPFVTNLHRDLQLTGLTIVAHGPREWEISCDEATLFYPFPRAVFTRGTLRLHGNTPKSFEKARWNCEGKTTPFVDEPEKPQHIRMEPSGPLGLRSPLFRNWDADR